MRAMSHMAVCGCLITARGCQWLLVAGSLGLAVEGRLDTHSSYRRIFAWRGGGVQEECEDVSPFSASLRKNYASSLQLAPP